MTNTYKAPFGTYTGAEICSAAAQAEIIANINSLRSLVTADAGEAPAHPDFGKIDPAMAAKIDAELAAMIVVIDAMPTA